jgi:hypothetical protein
MTVLFRSLRGPRMKDLASWRIWAINAFSESGTTGHYNQFAEDVRFAAVNPIRRDA